MMCPHCYVCCQYNFIIFMTVIYKLLGYVLPSIDLIMHITMKHGDDHNDRGLMTVIYKLLGYVLPSIDLIIYALP